MENINIAEIGSAILALLVGIHAIAVVIVNVTDTPDDDGIPGKIYKVIEILAGILGTKAKQYPGEGNV